MDLARDITDFVERPLERCVAGAGFLVWCAAPDLAGSVQWGPLDDRCVAEMLDVARFIHDEQLAGSARVLVDWREIARVDSDAVLYFIETARHLLEERPPRSDRHVVVLPPGPVGLLLAGALRSLTPTDSLYFATELDRAFQLLGHPGARKAYAAAVAQAHAVRNESHLHARVRAHLARELVRASVDGCAAALGVSARTLQRELARLGTSFSVELQRARVAAIEELLLHSDLTVDAIAERVGLRNASRVGVVLRRELNTTPSALRARRSV
jgi:AraC-like DNA-binding protein